MGGALVALLRTQAALSSVSLRCHIDISPANHQINRINRPEDLRRSDYHNHFNIDQSVVRDLDLIRHITPHGRTLGQVLTPCALRLLCTYFYQGRPLVRPVGTVGAAWYIGERKSSWK